MRLESKKLLFDVLQAAERAAAFVVGRTLDDYRRDVMLRSAVERQLEIVGEAIRQIAKSDEELAERIPGHRTIVAFRNVLAHGYAEVDDEVVWGIVTSELPALRDQVRELLESA